MAHDEPVPTLILASSFPEDRKFYKSVAASERMTLMPAVTPDELRAALKFDRKALVVWSADAPAGEENLLSQEAVEPLLAGLAQPERVFVVSSRPPAEFPGLFANTPFFQHHLFRQYPEAARELVGRLLRRAVVTHPFGITGFFPAGSMHQTITLRKAEQRKPAVEAIQSFLGKRGLPPRLATQVAQAADELLMNAIYQGPRSKEGAPTRAHVDRAKEFDFGEREAITLETCSHSTFGAICIADPFGTLAREPVLRALSREYRSKAYAPRVGAAGTGLGLVSLAESGVSVLFVVKPQQRTEAYLFFPITRSIKEFRQSFHFFGYLGAKSKAWR